MYGKKLAYIVKIKDVVEIPGADRNTMFSNNLKHKSEGFVLRLRSDYNVSFKVKNPNYSI